MNTNFEEYIEEIQNAKKFLDKHKEDQKLRCLLAKLKKSNKMHSQKWAILFDYMYDHYNYECMNSSITTGLSYLVSD
jgi:hypothetical protein